MVGKENFSNAYEFANMRHEVSSELVEGKTNISHGLLTEDERRLCLEKGMILPQALSPSLITNSTEHSSAYSYDIDRWLCRIGCTVDGDPAFGVSEREGGRSKVQPRPAFVIDGVFDVFHGGQWSLANEALTLAEKEGGYVYVLVQNNGYIREHKNKLPIFDQITRLGWFRDLGDRIDGVVIWHTPSGNKSWESGYDLLVRLSGVSSKIRPKQQEIFFVSPTLPGFAADIPPGEREVLENRKTQVLESGLLVAEVESTYIDTSSSQLRKKHGLQSTIEVLEWENNSKTS